VIALEEPLPTLMFGIFSTKAQLVGQALFPAIQADFFPPCQPPGFSDFFCIMCHFFGNLFFVFCPAFFFAPL